MLNWHVLHEMDDEKGNPTGWSCELSNPEAVEIYGKYLWISKYSDKKYSVEYMQGGEYVTLKNFTSLKAAKRYAEIFS